MSKEEIKAAIAEKIAGQGNQLDLSGSLDGILQEIVDIIPDPTPAPEGPLVIEGELYVTVDEDTFVRPKDTATYTKAFLEDAYFKGQTIVIKVVTSSEREQYATIVGYDEDHVFKLGIVMYGGEALQSEYLYF